MRIVNKSFTHCSLSVINFKKHKDAALLDRVLYAG